jgi:hypothetical protein
MAEPLEMFAHSPGLLAADGRLERAPLKLTRVDKRLSDLAEPTAATLTQCEYCIDIGSADGAPPVWPQRRAAARTAAVSGE